MCYPCPRTPVYLLSGLNSASEEGQVFILPLRVADRSPLRTYRPASTGLELRLAMEMARAWFRLRQHAGRPRGMPLGNRYLRAGSLTLLSVRTFSSVGMPAAVLPAEH